MWTSEHCDLFENSIQWNILEKKEFHNSDKRKKHKIVFKYVLCLISKKKNSWAANTTSVIHHKTQL